MPRTKELELCNLVDLINLSFFNTKLSKKELYNRSYNWDNAKTLKQIIATHAEEAAEMFQGLADSLLSIKAEFITSNTNDRQQPISEASEELHTERPLQQVCSAPEPQTYESSSESSTSGCRTGETELRDRNVSDSEFIQPSNSFSGLLREGSRPIRPDSKSTAGHNNKPSSHNNSIETGNDTERPENLDFGTLIEDLDRGFEDSERGLENLERSFEQSQANMEASEKAFQDVKSSSKQCDAAAERAVKAAFIAGATIVSNAINSVVPTLEQQTIEVEAIPIKLVPW